MKRSISFSLAPFLPLHIHLKTYNKLIHNCLFIYLIALYCRYLLSDQNAIVCVGVGVGVCIYIAHTYIHTYIHKSNYSNVQ